MICIVRRVYIVRVVRPVYIVRIVHLDRVVHLVSWILSGAFGKMLFA